MELSKQLEAIKICYVMPEPSLKGGMTMISYMMHDKKIIDDSSYFHFNSSLPENSTGVDRLISALKLKISFFRYLRKLKPNVVYVMTSSFSGYYDKIVYCLITKLLGIKSVLNPVGGAFFDFYSSNWINRILVKFSLSFPNQIFVGSQGWGKKFKEISPNFKVAVIPNPVNIDKNLNNIITLKSKTGIIKIVFIGTLNTGKGINEVIHIIRKLQSKKLDFKFFIVGSGELYDFLNSELKSEIKDNLVTITGFVSEQEKKNILSESSIFLLPSHFEVFPIAMLEAMSAGLAIVTTKVGSIPDYFKPNENGMLFDVGDTRGMLEYIIELMNNKSLLESIGRNNIQRAKDFDIANIVREHEDNFRKLLNAKS